MSLVGPRRLVMPYLPLYAAERARHHDVRSGITSRAQVNGRKAISWEEKFRLDVWYVDHRPFWLNLKILALMLRKVFAREGISRRRQPTGDRFRGSPG